MSRESKSNEWIKENGVWFCKQQEPKVVAKYQPPVCPQCGSKSIWETLIGYIPTDEHYHDPNRKTCDSCKHSWYSSCPVCGKTAGVAK